MTTIGHNNPPSMIEWTRDLAEQLSEYLREHPHVDTFDQAQALGSRVNAARKTLVDLESERTARVRPLNDQVKRINDEYRGPRTLMERVIELASMPLAEYAERERRRKEAEAAAARAAAAEAERQAREAEARELDAQLGIAGDIVSATVEADEAFADYKRADRDAKRAERDTRVRLGGLSLRSVEVLTVTDWQAAIRDIGFADGIRDAVLTAARAYRKINGRLPAGVEAEKEKADMTEANTILTAISRVMKDIGSLRKDGENKFHGYKYASAADLLHKLQPLMAREGLIVFQAEKERSLMQDGAILSVTYEFTIAHVTGAVWPEKIIRSGMATARNSKGGFDDKALNKCHTSAHKYFYLTLLEVPTGDYDDGDTDDDAPPVVKSQIKNKTQSASAHDPETGEIGPRAIPVGKTMNRDNWIKWGQQYMAGVKSSEKPEEADEWQRLNIDALERLDKEQKEISDRLNRAVMTWSGEKFPAPPGSVQFDGDVI